MKLDALLQRLIEDGVVPPETTSKAAAALAIEGRGEGSRASTLFLGCGAWITALILLATLAAARVIDQDNQTVTGIILLAISFVLMRIDGSPLAGNAKSPFMEQLSLAFNLAGQVLIYERIWRVARWASGPGIIGPTFLVAVIIYPLFPSFWMRFVALSTAFFSLVEFVGPNGLTANVAIMGVLGVIVGFLHLSSRVGGFFRDLAVSGLIFFIVSLFLNSGIGRPHGTPTQMASLIISGFAIVLGFWISERSSRVTSHLVVGIGAGALILGLFTNPGIIASLLLFSFGFAIRDRIVFSAGLFLLPVFLIFFYYDINQSLLAKSGILFGSGLLLMGLRWLVLNIPRRPDEAGSDGMPTGG